MKTADTIRVDQIADSVGKEIELNPQNKRIRAYHYKNEKQEIYYFVNEDEAVYSGEIRVPYLESCYAYDAWNGTKMAQEYRAEKEDATILSRVYKRMWDAYTSAFRWQLTVKKEETK